MAGNLTRINNNQITDASAGNVYVGVNAATKLQGYTVTGTKLANNLTYGSDMTITGNLTVNGTTTTVNTDITTIEDPVIVLASNQTGTPTVDIGFIGQRGTSNNVAYVWDESATEFVTAFTSTTETNTTITISSYANFHTNDANIGGNIKINGTTSFVGNVASLNVTGNVTGGNLLTPGLISSTGTITSSANITGGNVLTGGLVSATGTITGSSHLGSVFSASGNITGGNVLTGGLVSATGNITGGNVLTGGLISSTGTITSAANITGGNVLTGGLISSTGTITSAANITGGNVLTGGLVSATGTITGSSLLGSVVSASGNVTGGNLLTGGLISSTGTVTGSSLLGSVVSASGNVTGGNLLTGGLISSTGNITGSYFFGNGSQLTGVNATNATALVNGTTNITTANNGNANVTIGGTSNVVVFATTGEYVTGVVSASGTITGGNLATGGTASAAGNITGGNVLTGGLVSATGTITGSSHLGSVVSVTANITGGNVLTGGLVSAGATITGGNLATGGTASAAGNITGGNVLTGGLISATSTITSSANITGGNILTGGLISATGNITGGNVNTTNLANAGAITIKTTASNGNINLTPNGTGNIVVGGSGYINNLSQPVQDNDAASKIYVDNMVSTALAYHQAVTVATTTTLATTTGGTIAYVEVNGAGNGIGAKLTTTGSFNLIDSANVQTVGTRILVKNEGNAAFNGVYTWANATSIVRSTDADQYGPNSSDQLSLNDYFFVSSGTINEGTAWVVDGPTGTITFGTSNITFAQFSSSQVYEANTSAGLSLTGTTFSAKVDNNTTAFDGGGNIIVKASANLTTPNIGAATGTSLNVTANVDGGNLRTSGLITATGNITGGNVLTGGLVSATGTVTGSSLLASVVSASANITGGNILTGGLVSATGTVTGSSLLASVVSASGNVTGGNLLTGGIISGTGNITGGNVLTGGLVSATGTVTGSSLLASVVSASGNVTGGNLLTGGLISATSTITSSANITGGNVLTGGLVSATGTVTGSSHLGSVVSVTANITGGNILTGGLVSATGNLTSGNILTGGLISATGTITGSSFLGTVASLSGNVTGGNLLTGGLISATSTITSSANITGGNILTGGLISATGTITGSSFLGTVASLSGNVTGGNVLTGGLVSATGTVTGSSLLASVVSASANITGGNILTGGLLSSTGNITSAANVQGGNVIGTTSGKFGNIVISGDDITDTNGRVNFNTAGADVDFAVNADTVANVFYIDAGTGTASFGSATQTTNALVAFNTTSSVLMPVGNVGTRPSVGVTGMLRFNTTNNALEVYDNSAWTTVGVPSFTVIADNQFTGDGVTVAFTLGSSQTTNSCIVSINGIVQIPTTAYSVSGTTLTFTEAPQSGDLIDVRQVTTTTTVTSISNSSGNAVVGVIDTANVVSITGDLLPASNSAQSLGNSTLRWSNLWVSGSTITLGNVVMKNVPGGNTIAFYGPDGTTPATISSSSVDTTQIASGTSNAKVVSSGGNITVNVGGTSNVAVFATTGATINGDLTVTGNATLSGNILGDRVQNGTTSFDIQTQNGNANITVGGTSNVAVFATTGAFITGLASVTANITGGNILTGGLISATANITGGNLLTGGLISAASTITGTSHLGSVVSVTANITGGNVLTGGLISATGNVTGGNLILSGSIVDTGDAVITSSAVNANVTLTPTGTGTVIVSKDITNGQANATGNIGSATGYFNTVFAKATSALYADLAEKYVADAAYAPGTVVVFGGTKEVTVSSNDADRSVAGVISTNPSYIMNGGLEAEFVATVALTGRVPCRVTGTVRKGDLMVSAGYGLARAEQDPKVGTVIGKALEDFEGNEGVIEVVVGRF